MGRRPNRGRESNYSVGDIVEFHSNPMDPIDENILGIGLLLDKLEEATVHKAHVLPEEEVAGITRSLEKWSIEVISLSPKGESYHRVGDIIKKDLTMIYGGRNVPSGATSLKHVAGQITHQTEIMDSFIKVNGIEVF